MKKFDVPKLMLSTYALTFRQCWKIEREREKIRTEIAKLIGVDRDDPDFNWWLDCTAQDIIESEEYPV